MGGSKGSQAKGNTACRHWMQSLDAVTGCSHWAGGQSIRQRPGGLAVTCGMAVNE